MTRRNKMLDLPNDAIVVKTYEKLERYLIKFAEGEFGMVLLLGRHGTGKTRGVKQVLGIADAEGDEAGLAEDSLGALYVEGQLTPYGLYQKLCEYRNCPVVVDDLDGLHAKPGFVHLLKPLCNTTPVKRVLQLCGQDTYYLQTANSRYRLEVRSNESGVVDQPVAN